MFVPKRLLWSTGKEAGESFAGTATTLHAKGSGGGGGGSRGGGSRGGGGSSNSICGADRVYAAVTMLSGQLRVPACTLM